MAAEKNLENKLMRECKRLGVLCEKYPPIFWASVPDRLLILPNGGVIWVERLNSDAHVQNLCYHSRAKTSTINFVYT